MPLRSRQNTAFCHLLLARSHHQLLTIETISTERGLSVFFLRNKGGKMANTARRPEVPLRKLTVMALERLVWERKYFMLCLSYYICIRQLDFIKDN